MMLSQLRVEEAKIYVGWQAEKNTSFPNFPQRITVPNIDHQINIFKQKHTKNWIKIPEIRGALL